MSANREDIPCSFRPFELSDEPAVIALWERCGLTRSWNDPRKDIRRKLDVRPDLFLVGVLEGRVVASVMAGYEAHRGWINYLAVSPEHHRKGFGRIMMAEAERRLHEAGCPKINLQVRSDDVAGLGGRLGYQAGVYHGRRPQRVRARHAGPLVRGAHRGATVRGLRRRRRARPRAQPQAGDLGRDETVYVGDMALDAESAARAGVTAILVAVPGGDAIAELERTGATVVDRLEAILDFLPPVNAGS